MRTGAMSLVATLEQLGVRRVFGIPGTHNTEVYDELAKSELIQTILVADERSAAFMADGYGRASGELPVLHLVPGAGLTHALSGIAEAYLDSSPLLIISCGIRTDNRRAFQLHDIDQVACARPVVKAAFVVDDPVQLEEMLTRAAELAMSGEPGPVLVEIAVNILLFNSRTTATSSSAALPLASTAHVASEMPQAKALQVVDAKFTQALDLIAQARRIGLYVGNGARDAAEEIAKFSELLQAPVASTISGKGIYPEDAPFAVWCGFGKGAPRFARKIFEACDLIVAIGCKFGEVGTCGYSISQPKQLLHIDRNPAVFDRNFRASLSLEGDARSVIGKFLIHADLLRKPRDDAHRKAIQHQRKRYLDARGALVSGEKISPARLFRSLREMAPRNAAMVTDCGNHEFLAMELFPCFEPRTFIAPVDFSCMGFGAPAAVGACIANPERLVIAVIGDGAFRMTGLELISARALGLGLLCLVFNDGRLGLISHFQERSYGRAPATTLYPLEFRAQAAALGASYFKLQDDTEIDSILTKALADVKERKLVIVEVMIDYSAKTAFEKGVVASTFSSFPLREKVRFLGRSIKRHALG